MATVFGLEGTYKVIAHALSSHSTVLSILDWMWSAFFFTFVGIGINLFSIDGSLTISQREVTCSYKTLFGPTRWRAPISTYLGIRVRRTIDTRGSFNARQWRHELAHPERDKSVVLMTSGSADHLAEDMARYQAMINLPDVSKKQWVIT